MPVKQHTVPLAPAWTFALLVGRPAPIRLRGWYQFETDAARLPNGDFSWDAAGGRLWAAHGEALMQEAAAAGFAAYWATKRIPRGPAVRAWCGAFLRTYGY